MRMTGIALTNDDIEELICTVEGRTLTLESGRSALKLDEVRGDEHRWYTYYQAVFQVGDHTFAFDYPKPNSTEESITDMIEWEDIQVYEVKPVEVTTTVYEKV